MRRALNFLPAALAALAACAPAASAPAGAQTPAPPAALIAVIDSVAATPPLDRTHWGIEVTDLQGRVLARRNADKLFAAASNAKLATVAAALELLGPAYRWTTRLEARGAVGGEAAALVVRGSGDPTLSSHFHDDPLAPFDSLADSLALGGIRRIAGPVVVDQSRFDSVLVHPAWENFDLDWYYAAPVAPFAVLEGAYPVVMRPAAPGGIASVELLVPAGLVRVDARVMTVDGSRRWDDDLRRVPGTDSVVFRGQIGAGAGPDTSWIAQDDPGRLAGRAMTMALERRGIEVTGPVIVTRDPAAIARLGGPANPAAAWRSPPLSDVARISLEQSDNWVTEQVLKTLGAELRGEGSWSAGTAAVEAFLAEQVRIAPAAVYLRDGSGLTSQTLLTPAALTQLLRYAEGRPWAPVFRHAMVAPGELDGTLEDRLVGYAQRVTAKTGTLRHVNVLSGYAMAEDGEWLVFSLMTNASGRPSTEVQRALDRIVEAILRHGS